MGSVSKGRRVAAVTGSRRGIGLGIALVLGKAGYDLVLSGVSDGADEALAQVRATGARAEYIRCDISAEQDRTAFFEAALAHLGRLDVLVNNAGVAPRQRLDVLETDLNNFAPVLETNLTGTFFMCQLGARVMLNLMKEGLDNYAPRLINISSVSAYAASVNRGEYCVSKAGVSMVTALFAARLAGEGIPVFEVRPGIIETDMTAGVRDKYQAMIAGGLTPVPRMGVPEDVARCVLACAETLPDFATGQVLNADGGFHLRTL